MQRSFLGGAAAAALVAIGLSVSGGAVPAVQTVWADNNDNQVDCPVSYQGLRAALRDADQADGTGLNNHYWAVAVNRGGVVCAVAYSGSNRGAQWLLSRQIAAAKAFTANGLSLDGAPISTAQLYPWVQPGAPGNPLFGLAGGNPVSPEPAYDLSLIHI